METNCIAHYLLDTWQSCVARVAIRPYMRAQSQCFLRFQMRRRNQCGVVVVTAIWGALARLGLARAYALDAAKDPAARDKARTAYQNFLILWKDADPEIPIYQQATTEYVRLQ